MPIQFDQNARVFHLANAHMSMIIGLHDMTDGSTAPLMRYFGAPLTTPHVSDAAIDTRGVASFDTANAILPFACPTGGHGDFRPTQLTIIDAEGYDCTRLTYKSHEIYSGKRPLAGLPATYAESGDEATTLVLHLMDEYTKASVHVSYTLFEQLGAVAVSTEIVNDSDVPLVLAEAGSVSVSLNGSYEMLHLNGAWSRERQVERVMPMHGERTIRSTRGASGHQHNPFVALLEPETTEFSGAAYGVNLVYSGNFRITVDEDAYGQTRVVAGLDGGKFRWTLDAGASFGTPEAVLVYSRDGLNGMSQTYHKLYRERLCRGKHRDLERPILVNNWEATYFNFDEEKLVAIAKTAAELGVELFVLDDGWFGKRDSDNCALGDWFEDPKKLPEGLPHLSERIHALGLKFGLWFEPEMISEDSDLYRAHPDWCLGAPGRFKTQARQQWILDMSRPDVQDYLIDIVGTRLDEGSVDYVKWDMNRNFAEIGSALLSADRQCELPHRYMLGLYRVMEEITSAHPDVLFEGCSGGGGRFDAGMLYYTPQIWTSDDSDAVERLKIQYGTTMAYPPCTMGAHVSAVPNHQVGRMTGLAMRGHVAMGGVFGYELDLSKLSDAERAAFADQVRLAKELRSIVRTGTFTRLVSPFENNVCAWQFATETDVLVFAFQVLQHPSRLPQALKLHGVPEGQYKDAFGDETYDKAYLENVGLHMYFYGPTQGERGDFLSSFHHLRKV